MRFVDEFADDAVEPEPPEPPVEHERPQWLGPPAGELGIAVPVGIVLARSGRGVVAVSHALVHSTGISFEVVAHVGGLKPGQVHTLFHEQHAWAPGGDELPDGFLRFGVELADGRRASNLGRRRHLAAPEESPHVPVLFQHGGGGGGQSSGGGASWSLAFWLWPLPPDGPLTFVCEWPVAQIELARAEIEAGPLIESARLASPIWAADEGGGAWTSSVGQSVLRATAAAEPSPAEPEQSVSLPLERVRELEAALQAALSVVRRAGRA